MKKTITHIVIIIIVLSAYNTNAQSNGDSLMIKFEQLGKQLFFRNYDSTYIKSYDDKINIHLLAANKYSFFQAMDIKSSNHLFYRPELGLTLGAGISHKWFAIDLSYSTRVGEDSELTESDFLDFQGRIFSSKQYIEATLQYYYGYKLSAISSFYDDIDQEFKSREDMRSIHINLQYLFAFNYSKFSIKAPYVFTQNQEKSAGSVVAGAAFTLYVFDADSSIVPSEFADDFDPQMQLVDFNNIGVSINAGYMYTAVVKSKFYYNIGLIPGLDLNKGDYFVEERHKMGINLSFRLRFMNALGYNGDRMYCGAHFIGNAFSAKIEPKLKANIGYTKIGFVLGYRFNTRSSKK